MQRRRLRRPRSALLRLCASDSPVPHTKGLLLPTFCRFSALRPPPSGLPGLQGAPGRIPRAAWSLGCPPLPRQTSPNFPQTRRAGEGPWRRACAPPSVRCSQGSGEPGWSRTSILGGPPNSCSLGSRGSGAVCLPWRLEVAARRQALRSLLSLRMEVSKRGSRKRRAERGEDGLNKGRRWNPRLPMGRPWATTSPGRAGSPRTVAYRGPRNPGRKLWRTGFASGPRRQR